MRLRHILMVLSLLAFLSTSAGGALYYLALRQAAFKEAERQAVASTELIRKSLNSLLFEHRKPAATLASMPPLQSALLSKTPDDIFHANVVLDRFKSTLDTDVCYLMDVNGTTIASSNRNDPDSFVGSNFAFRPYYKQAIRGAAGAYLAVGTNSNKRGVYHSYPVFDDPEAPPIGLAVIKAPIDKIEKTLGLPSDAIVLVIDSRGLIFISSRPGWLYQSVRPLTDTLRVQIVRERQFGRGPWKWVGLKITDGAYILDAQDRRYLFHDAQVDYFPGWRIIHLRDMELISKQVLAPLMRVVAPLVILISVMTLVAVAVLYQKASREIFRRRSAEQALRQSESRYRSLYHHTPAMLHSIDTQANILSVSDYWVEIMGYSRQEVIGRPLLDFFTPESRRYAEKEIFPMFFRTGMCKEIPYRFVKKDGRIIDVLLSAIADRNTDGAIQRSLAVSIDVTERKRAEEALRLAKEELSRYSRELEKQVAKRTSEISSILEQLRRLSGSIMANQEKERAAIARELHDELGQVLTALRMDAVWLQAYLKREGLKGAERARTMCALIDSTIEEVRGLAIRLRPGVLDDLGLVDALEWYTGEFERRYQIPCVFSPQKLPAIDETLATAAYRIAQEALTNVARHADAGRVEVRLGMADGQLVLTVCDDGRGFKPQEIPETDALGLAGMRERAALVGGTLSVDSQLQGGTCVSLRVALDRSKSPVY